MIRVLRIRRLNLGIQLLVAGAENAGQRRAAIEFAGGADLAQTRAFSKQCHESLILLGDLAERQPLSQNDRPGKHGKYCKQDQNNHRDPADMPDLTENRALEWSRGCFLKKNWEVNDLCLREN